VGSSRTQVTWLLVALGVFGGLLAWSRLRAPAPAPPPARPSWQRPVSELSPAQQQVHSQLRAQLRAVERARTEAKAWPEARGSFPLGFARRQRGTAVNYVGEAEGLRWLVLYLEPDPRLPREPAPPEDDEHHALGDGTPLHVTVWTQPLSEPAPADVTAFPAAEGWVERVRR
jgi:hypothetical protein